jgi:Ca2+-binding EF-hand superfamily protein
MIYKAIASAFFIAIASQAAAGSIERVDRDRNRLIDRHEIASWIVEEVRSRDRSRDLKLTYGELIFRDLDGPAPVKRETAILLMAAFDTNRDGQMTIHEILSTLARSRLFETTDANSDGYVSTREAQAKGFFVY